MTDHLSPQASTSAPPSIRNDDATPSVADYEPGSQDGASVSPSEPDGTSFAVWGSRSPNHHTITQNKTQANMFATYFSSLRLLLTHVTEHNSRVAAELFLTSQTPDLAQYMKLMPYHHPTAMFFETSSSTASFESTAPTLLSPSPQAATIQQQLDSLQQQLSRQQQHYSAPPSTVLQQRPATSQQQPQPSISQQQQQQFMYELPTQHLHRQPSTQDWNEHPYLSQATF